MIDIQYKISNKHTTHEVSVKGHAQSGAEGHDILCASVSALFYTLLTNAMRLEGWGKGKILSYRHEKGDGYIQFKALNQGKANANIVFETICEGFKMLAEEYPKNISFA